MRKVTLHLTKFDKSEFKESTKNFKKKIKELLDCIVSLQVPKNEKYLEATHNEALKLLQDIQVYSKQKLPFYVSRAYRVGDNLIKD